MSVPLKAAAPGEYIHTWTRKHWIGSPENHYTGTWIGKIIVFDNAIWGFKLKNKGLETLYTKIILLILSHCEKPECLCSNSYFLKNV